MLLALTDLLCPAKLSELHCIAAMQRLYTSVSTSSRAPPPLTLCSARCCACCYSVAISRRQALPTTWCRERDMTSYEKRLSLLSPRATPVPVLYLTINNGYVACVGLMARLVALAPSLRFGPALASLLIRRPTPGLLPLFPDLTRSPRSEHERCAAWSAECTPVSVGAGGRGTDHSQRSRDRNTGTGSQLRD